MHAALAGREVSRPAVGSGTSVVTTDLMDDLGVGFPEAHQNADAMAELAAAGHSWLGFDNVMPLFSVWHESAALGCEVDWGSRRLMPTCARHLLDDIREQPVIPDDLLERAGCAVPLKALALLRRRFGNGVAVTGKVFGPWTLAYHVYGIENFLMATLTDPDAVLAALRGLLPVTLRFARAQIEAGADSLTLADHCTRDLCAPAAYRTFLKPLHTEIKRSLSVPLILHICGDTSDRIADIAETGIDCFHFDSKVPAATARRLAGTHLKLMGGTSNLTTVLAGSDADINADILEKRAAGVDILGPECAVPLNASWKRLQKFTNRAKHAGANAGKSAAS
jgi:[methyl-Co(III) methanol-specific corrinoid protein]:coenzyme M methyltransferase